ncbi:phage tail tape measure protein [Arthrobacter sp. AL12]|uniref:phage tail tape measure protein n=1 Tax=Arthrobacter sp. AL12 TaxID=3042241 RepID=UPI00249CB6DC|nr:phage tail tape measure protein [Arthrobacter sp. AL12]MDI3211703.1 phage tail tape measure protein [Arthrobacter sp. AL12]
MTSRDVIVKIRAEIGDFRRQMDQAATAAREMGRTTEQAGQATQEALTEARAAAQLARVALNDAGKAAQEAAQGFGLSYNSAGRLTDQFGNMVTEAHAAELGLDTASDATREFAAQQQHAAGELAATTAAAGEATTHMGRLSASVRDHEDAWDKAGGTLLAFGAAVVAGVGLAIAKYAEFDKAMSEVSAATHETAGNMQLLRDAAIEMGADTSFSATEAADAITELSKAGVLTKDILSGGLAGALSLAAAGSLGVADAAELAATAMTQFKLKGSDLPHVADLLAAGAGKAQGSVEDMGAALKQGGLVAAATGLTIEETTGTFAAFASAGLIGSDAGTSFKTMLQALTPSSEAASKEMERLGISAYDSQGDFIGMAEFAGKLQTSLSTLSVEQRAASQKIIFGSDAVRASNVLYEQGAAGIQGWIDGVNESGFAASTAAIKQDNLAGDLEKLGGSFDTVLIQGGGGAATALRGLVQGLEDVIDGLGKVKPEFLGLATGMTGVIGVTALLAGGFITLLPKVLATRAAFQTLAATNAPLTAGLGKIGKAAGGAMVALLALSAIGAIFGEKQTTSAAEYANAIMKVSAAGKNADSSGLDSLFQSFDKFGGSSTVSGVNSLSDAIGKLTKNDWQANVNQFFDGFTGMIPGVAKSELGQLDEKLKGLGETLGEVTSNGGAASAAKTFNLLTEEFKKNGKGAQDALDKMPGYKDALLKLGQAAGIALEPNELLALAAGTIPTRMLAAQKSTEGQAAAAEAQAVASAEAAEALEEMGLSADGVVISLSKLLDAMFATGIATMSARDAEAAYQENLDALKVSIDEVMATQKAGNMVLDATTGAFDLSTVAGRAANGVFGELEGSARATTKAMADAGATQPELQAKLGQTYQSLKDTAMGFGMGETKADDMARAALGIPKGVPIDVAIQGYADTMAKAAAIKQAVDNINPNKTIFFRTDASGFYDPSAGTDGKGAGSGGKSSGPKAYANGGINGAFGAPHVFAANGLHRQSMIARGGANITWAEPETGWEAYISGKPGQEARNRGIMQTIAPRLGLEVVPSKSMTGGYGQNQSFAGYSPAAVSMSAASGRGATFGDINITEQSDPRATFMEFSRRANALSV